MLTLAQGTLSPSSARLSFSEAWIPGLWCQPHTLWLGVSVSPMPGVHTFEFPSWYTYKFCIDGNVAPNALMEVSWRVVH